MKKLISSGFIIVLLTTLFMVISSSAVYAASKKVELTFDSKEFVAEKDGAVVIKGSTSPKAKLKINKKKVDVKKNGSFEYKYTLNKSDDSKTLNAVATEKGYKKNKQKIRVINLEKSNQKKSKKDKTKISLTNFGDFQFSGMANIKPTEAKIKSNTLTFYFDWRNDDGTVAERSYNGSGVTVIAYQNNTELESLDDDVVGRKQYIEKNTSLEIVFKYSLIDKSPVTIKMIPLEGETKEFTFDLT